MVDLRQQIDKNYRPVGATDTNVYTQGIDWDSLNKGITNLANAYMGDMKSSIGEANKQLASTKAEQDKLLSGQYQVQAEDVRNNPMYQNSDGSLNSRGVEAMRNLRVNYARLGREAIQSVESSVGADYKSSLLGERTRKNIEAQVADEQAVNKSYVDLAVNVSPSLANASYEDKLAYGKQYYDKSNVMIQTYESIKNNGSQSVRDPLIRSLTDKVIGMMTSEQLQQLVGSDDSAESQAMTVDAFAALGVQMGMNPTEARALAIDVGSRVHKGVNEYRKTLVNLNKDEIDFLTTSGKKQALSDMTPNALAYYSLTGENTPIDNIKFLANSVSSDTGDKFAYENVNGQRVMRYGQRNKQLVSTMLNYGNPQTKSATIAGIFPQIKSELDSNNIEPLMSLSSIPNMAGVFTTDNRSPEFQQAKKNYQDSFAEALGKDIRSYVNTGWPMKWVGKDTRMDPINNRVIGSGAEEINAKIKGTANAMYKLGYTDEEIKSVIDSGLQSVGVQPRKGKLSIEEMSEAAYEDIRLAGEAVREKEGLFSTSTIEPRMREQAMAFKQGRITYPEFVKIIDDEMKKEGLKAIDRNATEPSVEQISVGDMSQKTKETFVRPTYTPVPQMTMSDIYQTKEYKDKVKDVMGQFQNNTINQEQATNEILQFATELLGIKRAEAAEVVPVQFKESDEEIPVYPKSETNDGLVPSDEVHVYYKPRTEQQKRLGDIDKDYNGSIISFLAANNYSEEARQVAKEYEELQRAKGFRESDEEVPVYPKKKNKKK